MLYVYGLLAFLSVLDTVPVEHTLVLGLDMQGVSIYNMELQVRCVLSAEATLDSAMIQSSGLLRTT